jgi:hypothetical protein
MSKPSTITKNLFPGTAFFGCWADFYIKAEIQIDSFGSPETGRGYMADPAKYDPGSGPEWSIVGTPELFHDCGGDGEKVQIGPKLVEALKEFIESDKRIAEQIEESIAKEQRDEARFGL